MRRTRRMLGATVVTLASTALLVAGGGIASAATTDGSPPPTPQAPITLSQEQSVQVCTVRIPKLLGRIDKLQTRIAAGADTPGSTAFLQQRVQKAKDAGRTAVADRLQKRLDQRPDKVTRLADAKTRIEQFKDEKCA
jgi:hypothetical protein